MKAIQYKEAMMYLPYLQGVTKKAMGIHPSLGFYSNGMFRLVE